MIGGTAPPLVWKKNFRMSREDFDVLADHLTPYLTPDKTSPNFLKLNVQKKLTVTLYYLKDTGSLLMTANTSGIAMSTV